MACWNSLIAASYLPSRRKTLPQMARTSVLSFSLGGSPASEASAFINELEEPSSAASGPRGATNGPWAAPRILRSMVRCSVYASSTNRFAFLHLRQFHGMHGEECRRARNDCPTYSSKHPARHLSSPENAKQEFVRRVNSSGR